MNIALIFETLVHLKSIQIVFQVVSRFSHPSWKNVVPPIVSHKTKMTAPIQKYPCYDGTEFCFLNIRDRFASWDMTAHGMLWAYNLNYMDWLQQECISEMERGQWIDEFMAKLPQNHIGQDPYPIALRSINWIKAFVQYPELKSSERDGSLYSQVKLLERKLEYRLLGNHLLEDAYALFIASIYYGDKKLYRKAWKLLKCQLDEQVLKDGAHYEQSPMYHCILLDRLLDCYNFSKCNRLFDGQQEVTAFLRDKAVLMLGHLESVVWKDRTIPLLNDAAYGIAPTPEQLSDYAKRLGLSWQMIPMGECGYRRLVSETMEAIVDVGNITATYQPGHTHADTLNYELRIDGKPVVVDTGISTYNKTERRQYERSTEAHNCVVVDGKNSSEVWGGFRVGRRCHVEITQEDGRKICAEHDGFGKNCRRSFCLEDNVFVVEDSFDGNAISLIHLAEGVDYSRVKVEGATKIDVVEGKYSTEYNRFHGGNVLKIHFCGKLKYTIQ